VAVQGLVPRPARVVLQVLQQGIAMGLCLREPLQEGHLHQQELLLPPPPTTTTAQLPVLAQVLKALVTAVLHHPPCPHHPLCSKRVPQVVGAQLPLHLQSHPVRQQEKQHHRLLDCLVRQMSRQRSGVGGWQGLSSSSSRASSSPMYEV
jgi:hypothetical protein